MTSARFCALPPHHSVKRQEPDRDSEHLCTLREMQRVRRLPAVQGVRVVRLLPYAAKGIEPVHVVGGRTVLERCGGSDEIVTFEPHIVAKISRRIRTSITAAAFSGG